MTNTWSGFDGSVDETEDAIRSRFDGSISAVVGGYADCLVKANTSGTRTVDVAAGVSWAHRVRAKMDPAAVSFDVVGTSGQTRWDAVVHRRDWSANTVTLMKVNGISAVNAPEVPPDGLNDNPGFLHDQVLALVQTTYGASVPTAVRDWRLWSAKTLTAGTLAALPAASALLYGVEAVIGGARYVCGLNSSNAPAWIPVGGGYIELTGSDVLSSESGWSGTAMSIRGLYNPYTGEVQIDLQERRTGDAIVSDATTGNLKDTPVCTFKAPFRPQQTIPVFGQYAGGIYYQWTPFTAALGPSGLLTLQSGAPNVSVGHRSGSGDNGAVVAGDISLRALIRFTRKV